MNSNMNATLERKQKSHDRNSNFRPEEVDRLLTLIESKKDIVENKNKNANTCREKETIWQAIEIEYNSISTTLRKAKHLRLKYEALKRDVKKKNAVRAYISVPHNDNRSNSNDQLYNSFKEIEFTAQEKRVLAIISSVDSTMTGNSLGNISEEDEDKMQSAVNEKVVTSYDPEESPEYTQKHANPSKRTVCDHKYDSPDFSKQSQENFYNSKERGLKRKFTENESLQKLPKKMDKLNNVSLNFTNTTRSPKIGIMDRNRSFSEKELRLVQASILELIDKETLDSEYCPRFDDCVLKDGWLIIKCADEGSRTWLTERVNNLKPWEDASLFAMDEQDFPKPRYCLVRIPGPSLESKVLMQRLSVQNKHIGCRNWRLIRRKPNAKDETVIFKIDQKSCEALHSQDFKLYFNFGQITADIICNDYQGVSDAKTTDSVPSNELQKSRHQSWPVYDVEKNFHSSTVPELGSSVQLNSPLQLADVPRFSDNGLQKNQKQSKNDDSTDVIAVNSQVPLWQRKS